MIRRLPGSYLNANANAKRICTLQLCFRCECFAGLLEHMTTLPNRSLRICDVNIRFAFAFAGSMNRALMSHPKRTPMLLKDTSATTGTPTHTLLIRNTREETSALDCLPMTRHNTTELFNIFGPLRLKTIMWGAKLIVCAEQCFQSTYSPRRACQWIELSYKTKTNTFKKCLPKYEGLEMFPLSSLQVL